MMFKVKTKNEENRFEILWNTGGCIKTKSGFDQFFGFEDPFLKQNF